MNLDRLLFFENIRNDSIVRAAVSLEERAADGAIDDGDISSYYEIQRRLLSEVKTGDTDGTYWENYIYRLTAESENRFSLRAERGDEDEVTRILA